MLTYQPKKKLVTFKPNKLLQTALPHILTWWKQMVFRIFEDAILPVIDNVI